MTCQNCKTAPATDNWGGTHDAMSLARNQSLIQRWCHRCVLEAQIAHWRTLAPYLVEAERELATLTDGNQPPTQSSGHSRGSASAKDTPSHHLSDPPGAETQPRPNDGRYRANLEVALTTLVTVCRRWEQMMTWDVRAAIVVAEYVLTHGYPPQVGSAPVSGREASPSPGRSAAKESTSQPVLPEPPEVK